MSRRPPSLDDVRAAERASRHSVPTFDVRWFLPIIALVPVALAAGVYWLHQQPGGTQPTGGGSIIEVRLVRPPAAEPRQSQDRPDDITSDGRPEPLLPAPNRPIPEATTAAAPEPQPAAPAPGDRAGTPTLVGRPRPVPSGTAASYQSVLLSHIARFRRMPTGVAPGTSGVVQVLFSLRRDGKVLEVWVRSSSGQTALDQAAIETIRRAQPLPGIPADLPDTLTVVLPVAFDPS